MVRYERLNDFSIHWLQNTEKNQFYDSSGRSARYRESPSSDSEYAPVRIPWRGIILAVVLLFVGTIFISVSALILSGVMRFENLDNIAPYGVMIIGILCFIPGAYHVRLAYCAYRGYDGYYFEDIPNFD